jgi:hypothetical protein
MLVWCYCGVMLMVLGWCWGVIVVLAWFYPHRVVLAHIYAFSPPRLVLEVPPTIS